jgi:hypothetical protein
MDRGSFGLWGLDLAPEDFACALAALGVVWSHVMIRYAGSAAEDTADSAESFTQLLTAQALESLQNERPILWDLPFEPTRLSAGPSPPAHLLATAWQTFSPQYASQLRLELGFINHPVDEPFWLVEQLARPEVGLASVYVDYHDHTYEIGWNWPLRIGFLADADSQQLRQQLVQNFWAGRLWDPVTLAAGRDDCDLLLLPSGIRDALATVLATRVSVRADCILALGRVEEAPILLATLVSQMHTGGIGLVYVPVKDREKWLNALLDELAHNHPLDVALFNASKQAQTRVPLLFANHRLARFSRVARHIDKMSERFLSLAIDEATMPVSPQVANSLGLPPGPSPLRSIGERLRDRKPHFRWDHESGTGNDIAELGRAAPVALENVVPSEPQARWIQAQVFDKSDPQNPQILRRALRANAPHTVAVRIGARGEDWVAADAPFPEIPEAEGVRELTVVFAEPRLMPEPQVATIRLPPRGNSTVDEFYVHTRAGIERIEARITVLYENRILQTALLRASVVADPLEAPPDRTIEVAIEAVIRPGVEGLVHRNRFDAALILNHDMGHRAGVTKIADRRASFIAPPKLDDEIRWFDDQLSRIADDPDAFAGGLAAQGTVDILREFAKHGRLLYESIVQDRGVDDAIACAIRLQVIAAQPEARLPIEFFYDREAPDPHASLCPQAIEALTSGACTPACPDLVHQSSVICPLGFWGLNRVIERHAHDKAFTSPLPNWDFTLQAEPVAVRPALNVLAEALIAASHRVEKKSPGGIATVQAEIEAAIKRHPVLVTLWSDWVAEVAAKSPSLLILLVHTEYGDNNLQQIEIGEGAWLEVVYLKEQYIRDPRTKPPPLVLLIGCETGAPELTFHGFVAKLRRSGAAIVVSTGSTILGRHAIPITCAFVGLLARISSASEASFGDVMLKVRQRLLAQGLPMALCLMAYGDADWRLGSTPTKEGCACST